MSEKRSEQSSMQRKKRTPLKKEWDIVKKKEERFLQSRLERSDGMLARKLEEKIPEKLGDTLDTAFQKAFSLVFQKGTGVIEKTIRKQKLEKDHQVAVYNAELKEDKKALRSFKRKADQTGAVNLVISGAEGVGLGLLGVGIPDIPLFTALVLKNMYEMATHYGFAYDTEEEKYWILLLIRGALSYGEELEDTNRLADRYIKEEMLPPDYDTKTEIRKTSQTLSKELLYMKFLQGIPVAGAVGGAYDVIYLKRIQKYAGIKYRKRFLYKRARSLKE